MAGVPLKWVMGAVAVGAGTALLVRTFRSMSGTRSGPGGRLFPAIGADTWPPVPTNPDRPR